MLDQTVHRRCAQRLWRVGFDRIFLSDRVHFGSG